MRRFVLTQGTVGLVGEACKRLGVLGALMPRHDGLGWRSLGRRASAGPGRVQHDTQPQEAQDCQLVEKQVGNHDTTPSFGSETGGLYLIREPIELSAAWRYTTVSLSKAAMRAVEARLERNPLLPKWDILIHPAGAD
jgi:hypothetical protein